MIVPSCLEQAGAGVGESEWDWGEKRKIRLKNTIETDKEKIKINEDQKERKWMFRSLKAVEKLVLPIRSCWSITKRQKCSTLKLNIYHKKLEMKECTYLTCNRPSDSWENAKKKGARKHGEGAGLGREGERSSYSLPRLFSSVPHFAPLSTVHYPLSTVHCPLRLE